MDTNVFCKVTLSNLVSIIFSKSDRIDKFLSPLKASKTIRFPMISGAVKVS